MPDNSKILIVEDNRVNQLLIMKKFENQGVKSIMLAKNGQEALDIALKNNPALILMDIQLPDMNGNAVIQSLRNSKFTGQIVALSADALQEDMDRSLAAGAKVYITKPINFDTFFTQINNFLKLPDGQGKTPQQKDIEKNNIQRNAHPDRFGQSVSDAAKNVFVMDAKEKLQILAEALEHPDDEIQMAKIKAIAHEYKGNAIYFGLQELESTARELDISISNDQPHEYIIKLTGKLVDIVKGVVDEIN